MDTGTDQTWVQCEDCQHYGGCFGNPLIFLRNSKSRSYNPIPCDSHPLCYTGDCVDGYCSYRVEYLDRSVARGILAHESFTFGIGRGRERNDEVKFNLVFGCNRVYEGKPVNTDENGMLGLMWGRRSLIDQLMTQGVIQRDIFSYCVPHYDNTDLGGVGYLEIGTDDGDNDYYSSTALKRFGEISTYFIELNGISVGQTRLPIDPYIFSRVHDLGGSIIDSGCMFSYIAAGAYTVLTRMLKDYFSKLGNYKTVKPRKTDFQFGLCYKDLEAGRTGLLLAITLHYSGADLELEPDNVFFHLTPNVFCLAMYPAYNGMSILGAYQQSNFKFVYDRANLMLRFKKEYCHQSD
ncbi:aspartic proteinase nepenthesin-1-like [Silene latifolia]|uniref:aspartic proteinase nepenthesin-1-like n=1 Tax=Silene latifolia TaxID=37657 RepID=UPI003D781A44